MNHPYIRNALDYGLSIETIEGVEVLKRIESVVKWPPRMRANPEMRDKKYYTFHDDHGH